MSEVVVAEKAVPQESPKPEEKKALRFAYYPGCSLTTSAKDYNMSVIEVKALGLELELEDWSCCGATAAYSVNYLLSLALPTGNLALAEAKGLDIVTPCPECYYRLWAAHDSMGEDSKILEKVNKAMDGTGLKCAGSVDVKHILDVLVNGVGMEAIAKKVVRPLKGLKVVPYYGCIIVKPPRKSRFDSPENPMTMDRLISALGAESIQWDSKTRCCGGPIMLTNEKAMLNLSHDLLAKAKAAGAQAVVLPCQLCQLALDGKQTAIEETFKEEMGMPVLLHPAHGPGLRHRAKRLGLDRTWSP